MVANPANDNTSSNICKTVRLPCSFQNYLCKCWSALGVPVHLEMAVQASHTNLELEAVAVVFGFLCWRHFYQDQYFMQKTVSLQTANIISVEKAPLLFLQTIFCRLINIHSRTYKIIFWGPLFLNNYIFFTSHKTLK